MDVNDYLEKSINGTPQLKPDEKRRFLGNFKERCYFYVEHRQLQQATLFKTMKQLMQKNKGCLYIHSRLPMNIQNQAIQLAQSIQRDFMIVTKDTLSNDSIIFVYATTTAVPQEHRNITYFFNDDESTEENNKQKKPSLWQRILHK